MNNQFECWVVLDNQGRYISRSGKAFKKLKRACLFLRKDIALGHAMKFPDSEREIRRVELTLSSLF